MNYLELFINRCNTIVPHLLREALSDGIVLSSGADYGQFRSCDSEGLGGPLSATERSNGHLGCSQEKTDLAG